MTKGDTVEPNDTLTEWLRTCSPTLGVDREICTRLIASPDMHTAWPSLLKAGASPMQILNMTLKSYQSARLDARRLPNIAEKKSIKDVRKAATKLLQALQGAQLLDRGAPYADIDGVQVLVAWTTNCAKALEASSPSGFPVLGLPDLLRILDQRCGQLLDCPPANSIARKRNDISKETARAFLRHLDTHFREQLDREMLANLARIATAVFPMSDAWTEDEVRRVLRGSTFKKTKGAA